MEEYTNRELCILLKTVQKEIRTGFEEIHKRQDTTNGKVLRNCDDITVIKSWKNKVVGAMLLSNILLVPILTAVTIMFVKEMFF